MCSVLCPDKHVAVSAVCRSLCAAFLSWSLINWRVECKTMLHVPSQVFFFFSKVPEILHVVFNWIETHHPVFFGCFALHFWDTVYLCKSNANDNWYLTRYIHWYIVRAIVLFLSEISFPTHDIPFPLCDISFPLRDISFLLCDISF